MRGGDILLLAENFAAGMASDLGWPAFPGFGAAAAGRPEPADRGEKGTPDAPGPKPERPFDLRARVAELEKHLLAAALEANRFNQRRTAGYVGLTYHQLRNSLRRHGLLGQSQENP